MKKNLDSMSYVVYIYDVRYRDDVALITNAGTPIMTVTTSKLRANIYRLLDRVLETGETLEIERKGRRLQITPVSPSPKLSKLTHHDCLDCDPEDIVHMDWSKKWKNDLP